MKLNFEEQPTAHANLITIGKMADVDEDVIPPLPPPNDPSVELDEEIQDFRFLSALSQYPPISPPPLLEN